MRDRVLDEGDDIGIGDLTCGEIGEHECAGDVQRLFQGGRSVHGPIVDLPGTGEEGLPAVGPMAD
ncbi:hypothetical protein GCM10010215_14570 [Streptomyces virginiae]|nr:hypothetical protein GCM10010215_14570 [Streptomyces virginiae]